MGKLNWKLVFNSVYQRVYTKQLKSSLMNQLNNSCAQDMFLISFDGTWWRGIYHGETIIKGKDKENVINQAEVWMDENE